LAAADQAALRHGGGDAGSAVQACPLPQRHAIEALVVGEDGQPLADIAVQLQRDAVSACRSATDAQGVARFDGLEAGRYQLGLYELDRDAWELAGSAALAAAPAGASAGPQWRAPPDAGPRAELVHVVAQGECAAKIAYRYGLFVDTVWEWPANAALGRQRDSKYVLCAGDRLTVPPLRSHQVACTTDRRYTLRRKGVPERLDIQFCIGGVPRADAAYVLALRADSGQVLKHQCGRTTADGRVRAWVPPDTCVAAIAITEDNDTDQYLFAIGALDPVDAGRGVAARLASLGYAAGDQAPDGAALEEAVARFQQASGLPVTGSPDPETRAALLQASQPRGTDEARAR
jgi:hypothetical protein